MLPASGYLWFLLAASTSPEYQVSLCEVRFIDWLIEWLIAAFTITSLKHFLMRLHRHVTRFPVTVVTVYTTDINMKTVVNGTRRLSSRFMVLVVATESAVVWDMIMCKSCKYRHLQDRKVKHCSWLFQPQPTSHSVDRTIPCTAQPSYRLRHTVSIARSPVLHSQVTAYVTQCRSHDPLNCAAKLPPTPHSVGRTISCTAQPSYRLFFSSRKESYLESTSNTQHTSHYTNTHAWFQIESFLLSYHLKCTRMINSNTRQSRTLLQPFVWSTPVEYSYSSSYIATDGQSASSSWCL
jgi:hypothetical protein